MIVKTFFSQTWRDVRLDKRTRTIDVPDFTNVDSISGSMAVMSKSDFIKTSNTLVNNNELIAPPDADSEVKDTLRLYFELASLDVAHFDIVDPKDDLFQATTGDGANTMVTYVDLSLVTTSHIAAKDIIDMILVGTIFISDGETPIGYLEGKRL